MQDAGIASCRGRDNHAASGYHTNYYGRVLLAVSTPLCPTPPSLAFLQAPDSIRNEPFLL
jgi:hypothetical protein